MGKFLLRDSLIRQKKLHDLKEELSKSLLQVIISKLPYLLNQILFPNKKLNYKRLIAENLNKKAIIGFWCKWLNSLWNSQHSLGCGRANCEMLKQVQHDEILHFVQNDAPLCHPEFISGSNRLRGLKAPPQYSPKNGNTTTGFFGRFAPSRMTNSIRVVPSLFLSRSVILSRFCEGSRFLFRWSMANDEKEPFMV